MQTTEYLYGLQPHILKDMPYEQALELKKESALKLLREVTNEADLAFKHGRNYEEMQAIHY